MSILWEVMTEDISRKWFKNYELCLWCLFKRKWITQRWTHFCQDLLLYRSEENSGQIMVPDTELLWNRSALCTTLGTIEKFQSSGGNNLQSGRFWIEISNPIYWKSTSSVITFWADRVPIPTLGAWGIFNDLGKTGTKCNMHSCNHPQLSNQDY